MRRVVKTQGASAGQLRRWWSRLPPWEQELRILLYYPPPIALLAPEPTETVINAPDDPSVFPLHPYAYQRFIRPLLEEPQLQGLPPLRDAMGKLFETGRPRVGAALGLCLWVIGSRQDFDTGEGVVIWPREGDAETWAPSAKVILDLTAAKVSEILGRQRQGAPGAGPLDHDGLKAVRFSPDQLRALEALAGQKIDVPYVFGTLLWSTVMLAARLHLYRAIEAWRRNWKGLINKEKRGLIAVRRAHLKYWKDRLRPAAMEKLKEALADVDEILASLNRLAYPSRKTLRMLKGRLHVRGSRLVLPTEFISWTMREIEPRLGEHEASAVVARLVEIALPHVKPLSPKAVYAHFYRSL